MLDADAIDAAARCCHYAFALMLFMLFSFATAAADAAVYARAC